MKKTEKITKAVVVILIVGIGLLSNMNKQSGISYYFSPFYIGIESGSEKNDSVKVNENKLYIFTKKIIDSGIKQLFPTL